MAEYLVTWEINVDADSPEEAAYLAAQMQRRPGTEATVYNVYPHSDEEEDVESREIDLNRYFPCYQCEKPVTYLFADARCSKCTALTPEEVRGE